MYQTYEEFIQEFLGKIKQLIAEKKIGYESLQNMLGVNSKRSVLNILNQRRALDLAGYRALCNMFDLWPEWNLQWKIEWVVDGELDQVCRYHGAKEGVEEALMVHANATNKILTKELRTGYYYLDNKRVYVNLVHTAKSR